MRAWHIVKYGWFTSSPADILRSVDIGVRFVTATAAPKLRLTGAVFLLAVATAGACPAGITRIDSRYRHAGQSGLVFQKLAQLRESPGVQNGSLLRPGLDPFADALEFFHGNAALGAFSFGNDLLTDIVVHPRGETSLLPAKPSETPFWRRGFASSAACAAIADGGDAPISRAIRNGAARRSRWRCWPRPDLRPGN